MRHRFLAFALTAFFFVGCECSTPTGVITSFGEFSSPDGNHVLKIEKKSVSLVVGSVLDSARTVVFSEEIGSDAMGWCFYWSRDGSLWAYSDDTGYMKQITPKENSSVDVRSVSKGERLPEAVFDFLPSSLRGMYKK